LHISRVEFPNGPSYARELAAYLLGRQPDLEIPEDAHGRLDEVQMAYKNIREVIAAHKDLVIVLGGFIPKPETFRARRSRRQTGCKRKFICRKSKNLENSTSSFKSKTTACRH